MVVIPLAAHLLGCGTSSPATGAADSGANEGGLGPLDASSDGPRSMGDGGVSLFGDGATVDARVVVDKCHVPPDGTSENAPVCTKPPAPPNSFDPVLKWAWTEPAAQAMSGMSPGSMTMPLVAEMVDTNHDGEVNLCDVPSVIVTVNGGSPHEPGYIFMLSGDAGQVQAMFDGQVDASVTPALGDIDGDGLPEVVANDAQGHVVAYDHTGKIKWSTTRVAEYYADENQYCGAIALYDLDGDGKPEIIDAFEVMDNRGNHLFSYDEKGWAGDHYYCPAMTAADLDGDGKLEVIFGNAALHHDGTPYWTIDAAPGQPQVADLNGDGLPEIFLAREDGLLVLSHDGKQLIAPTKSFDSAQDFVCWSKAGAIGDFDGTGKPSLMDGSCSTFGIWHVGASALSLQWSQPIADPSGIASSTAFDFLGRGVADAVYGDEAHLWVYDGKTGALELMGQRSSGTLIEYPVVADVDNDGSADIVVVSNKGGQSGGVYSNTVEVFQDAQKRWAPTRRIWNQHAYHVTNVREDGTIPAHMKPSWKYLNTFRTNAQIESGGECMPVAMNQ
jgi:hypothetical protein